MNSDVFASYLTATGTAVAGKSRVKGALVTGTGTAVFRDGGASGTTRLTLNAAATQSVVIPENGILFNTDVHVTIAGLTAITVFYG
jgi:hypothetical protein